MTLKFRKSQCALIGVRVVIPVLLCCIGSGVLAQNMPVIDMSGFANSINLQATTILGNEVGREMLEPQSRQSLSAVRANPSILLYRTSLSRRNANLAKYVNTIKEFSPEGAEQIRESFARADLFSMMDSAMSQYGLESTNLADCFAVWWTSSWQAAHIRKDTPTMAMMQAVKRQLTEQLLSSSRLANASETEKQELADEFLIRALMLDVGSEQYANDPAALKELAAATRKGAKASGIDLDSVTLTNDGFVPARRRGGAVDPAALPGGEDPAKLAAVSAPGQPASAPASETPFALIAAAGGAGLGAMYLLGKAMGKRG